MAPPKAKEPKHGGGGKKPAKKPVQPAHSNGDAGGEAPPLKTVDESDEFERDEALMQRVESALLEDAKVKKKAAAQSEEANDMVYKILMDHKNAEKQKIAALASDARTLSESIIRKQVEAQRSRVAVSACAQYATNEKYVDVNRGSHPKIRVFPGMHALSPDEVDVYASLAESCPSARVTVMHNHCMSEQGIVEGFRFTLDARENHQHIPMNRKMFFRHSMVECIPRTSGSGGAAGNAAMDMTSSHEDHTILSLLLQQNVLQAKLVEIMKKIHEVCHFIFCKVYACPTAF